MTIISVPLNGDQERLLNTLVATGSGANRADVMRRALEYFAEDEAVRAVLESQQEAREEKIVRGPIDETLT